MLDDGLGQNLMGRKYYTTSIRSSTRHNELLRIRNKVGHECQQTMTVLFTKKNILDLKEWYQFTEAEMDAIYMGNNRFELNISKFPCQWANQSSYIITNASMELDNFRCKSMLWKLFALHSSNLSQTDSAQSLRVVVAGHDMPKESAPSRIASSSLSRSSS